MSQYTELLDKLIAFFSKGHFEKEVKIAKKEFINEFGVINHDDPRKYELSFFSFIEWYLFEWSVGSLQKKPIEIAQEKLEDLKLTQIQGKLFQNILVSRHSLFQLTKDKKESVFVKDLFSNYQFELLKKECPLFLLKNQIVEGRLIPHEKKYLFSRSLFIHPLKVISFILKKVKEVNPDEKLNLILSLRKMKYQSDKYPHIDVEKVYSYDSKFRF